MLTAADRADDAASGRGDARACCTRAPRVLVANAWPAADPALLVAETVTIAVQVMGKLRGTIEVPPDADEATCWRPPRPSPTWPGRWKAGQSAVEYMCPERS